MRHMTTVGNVIYVHIPGCNVRPFHRRDRNTAEQYHDKKCRELGVCISDGTGKSEEREMPYGVTLNVRKRKRVDGTVIERNVVQAHCVRDGKKARKEWTYHDECEIDQLIAYALKWRMEVQDKV